MVSEDRLSVHIIQHITERLSSLKVRSVRINGLMFSLVVDGTSGRLFIDGLLADEKNWTGESLVMQQPQLIFGIGNGIAKAQPKNISSRAQLIEVYESMIRALSEDEILELYEFEAPPATTVPPRPNTFFIQSIQAGSTTDIDNLVVTDLRHIKCCLREITFLLLRMLRETWLFSTIQTQEV